MGSGTNAVVEKQYDYTYDASGRLQKVTQSSLGTGGVLGTTDLAMTGVASASSHLAGYDAPRVIAGIGPDQNYGWVSATANGSSDWLSVT